MPQALALLLFVAVACSSSAAGTAEPGVFSCDYNPFGDGSVDFVAPSAGELGQFDSFVRVRVIGHSFGEQTAELENIVMIEEVVSGDLFVGNVPGLRSGFELCLETGDEYYVLARETDENGFLLIPNPWATFPVINNRITLHPDMRKDDLVGDLHGLDPVLFKRRFVELVGRDDIEVD